jgi:hypothetical protein
VSPILVRPVREQFEHDRIIRVLQARYKRRYEVAINPGAEQNASVNIGDLVMYPDLVLFSLERGKKIQATVEVETTESINTLEAMAEWGPYSRLRSAFFLYVPAGAIDTVRRLCTEHTITPTEIWTYHAAMDQMRFTMVERSPEGVRLEARAARSAESKLADARPAARPEPRAAQPAQAATSGGATNGKGAELRQKPEKARPPKKVAVRRAKPAKKARAKKLPRAAVARPRQVGKAKKAARKSSPKRSATPKR